MDLLALPDVFLRQLMRKMTIKDRLQLRHTCHAFEQLVADTNAGEFDRAQIVFYDHPHSSDSILLLRVNGEHGAAFSGIESSDEGFEVIINLIHRLCSGISFKEVQFELSDHDSPPEYVRRIIAKFTIKLLRFSVFYEPQLHRPSFKSVYDEYLLRYFSATGKHLQRDWSIKLTALRTLYLSTHFDVSNEAFHSFIH